MDLTLDISGLEDRLNRLKRVLETGDFGDALIFGIDVGVGLLQQRIFNNGKAADGTALGDYKSKYYKAKRAKAGRQIGYKDLEMTGSLRSGIKVVKTRTNVVQCIVQDANLIKIAQGQEKQTGKVIFKFSDTEKSISVKNCQQALMQKLRENVR